jgi:hypothetical protein
LRKVPVSAAGIDRFYGELEEPGRRDAMSFGLLLLLPVDF